jgi:ribonuclease HII
MPTAPCPAYEAEIAQNRPVLGIDEVGRGPLAGPVVAAAAFFPSGFPDGLNDSKKLTEKRRETLLPEVLATAIIGVGGVSARMIDEIGIGPATLLAMHRAAEAALGKKRLPDGAIALIDGNRPPRDFPLPVQTEVKADGSCPSVAGASIVAKVLRDRAMARLAVRHDAYGWHTNKGYGSKAHQEAILTAGVTAHHRRSFLTKLLS